MTSQLPPPAPQYGQYGQPVLPGPRPVGQDVETGEPITPDQRTQAVLAQALTLVGGWLVPLIFRNTSGKRSSFVRAHATAALNVTLTQLILLAIQVGVFAAAVAVGTYAASRSDDSIAGSVIGGLLAAELLVLLVFGVTGVVLLIGGAVRAARLRPPPRPRFVARVVK
jgi:hypothetical protein